MVENSSAILRVLKCSVETSQVMLVVKNQPANAGDIRDVGSIPGLGRSPGEGQGYPLQYSGLENSRTLGCKESDTIERLSLTHIQ